jgi:hypothetical protein
MNESTLTKDERTCLQSWFRQAIAKIEVEEATAQFLQNRKILEGQFDGHNVPVTRRRAKRATVGGHSKEFAL